MSSIQDALERARGDRESTKLLRGSDLTHKQQTVIIRVVDVRDAPPNFKSPMIIDHHPVLDGREAFPVNITNLEILLSKVGDDPSVLIGRGIVLRKYLTRNPQTKQHAFGLLVESVEGVDVDATGRPLTTRSKRKLKAKPASGKTLKKGRKKRTKRAAATSATTAKQESGLNEHPDVPF